jgi:hypothetical protein
MTPNHAKSRQITADYAKFLFISRPLAVRGDQQNTALRPGGIHPPRRFKPSRFLWLFLILLSAAYGWAASFDRAYWVWHRTEALEPEEAAELTGQKVATLYWNVGELENRGEQWIWKNPPPYLKEVAPGFHVVPVVRLTSGEREPFAEKSLASLERKVLKAARAGEVQIDFDCPDRLIGAYAAALVEIRHVVPHLSITALAHWPHLPEFPALARSVEEIAPMFYDLQPDPTGVSIDAPPPPLLDPERLATTLHDWSACPIPWRAGLPTFARLTVFDPTGLSRGQIPNWSWDDFCFHKNLHTLGPTRLGVTLLQADADIRVAGTPVARDEIVASRFVDHSALARAFDQARDAGARGAIYFRLADGSDPAGWSTADLDDVSAAHVPNLILRVLGGESFELVNDSDCDLAPRLAGGKSDRDRGYALEIDAPAPLFREALAGDFWRVTSHANPDSPKPVPVAVPLATRVTYWFSHLPARSRLQSGLLQFAPGATLSPIRYRVLNCEGASAWKPLLPVGKTATP